MSPKYEAKIDDRKYEVDVKTLDEGGLLIVKIGEQSYSIKTIKNEDGTWTANDTTSDYKIDIMKRSGSKIELEINGESRELEWGRLKSQESVTPTPTASKGGPKAEGGVYPPMPGKITEVHVSPGDSVSGGQTVCILEAMKMFNELKAPMDGVVKEVNIEIGSMVTPTDLLILIE
ncbi:MAG: hypothetical protein BAJATHORv1_30434 [Candidatus Thorarchaeota archaeon]|nr:MAG: hypothetical protein BAJATHORv1_30434 [Candidatus Thorarchaeota archaeon]